MKGSKSGQLFLWCLRGDLEGIRYCVEECNEPITEQHLIAACNSFNGLCVKYLIEHGADANITVWSYGWQDMIPFIATLTHNPFILKVLLETKPGITDSMRNRTLKLAFGLANSSETIRLLMQHNTRIDRSITYGLTSPVHTLFLYTYEEELDDKHRKCVRAAVTLMLILKRNFFPRDIRKIITAQLVLPTWLDDAWLSKRTRKK